MTKEYKNISIRELNSFGIDVKVSHLVEFESADDLYALFTSGAILQKWNVIAGGNNVLFTEDYNGTLLRPIATEVQIIDEDDASVTLRVDAGLEWDDLVEWAVQRDLWGIENLSLIPGKVGAAPVQNIGAYGAEAKDTIVRVESFRIDLMQMQTIENKDCKFAYRDSIFKQDLKGKAIITAIEMQLSKTPAPHIDYGDVKAECEALGGATLNNIRTAICKIRNSKLPDTKEIGNAGSFFKNPVVDRCIVDRLKVEYPDMPTYPANGDTERVKLAAGWLIDKVGMKGAKCGRVGVHPKQALVLINMGGATGKEVIEFAYSIQDKVKQKFGIEIDTEVNIW